MADRIILVFILVLTGVYFWATSQIPTLEIGDPLGPKAFPRLLGGGMLLTAVILLLEIIKERKTTPSTETTAPGERTQWRVILAVTVGTFVFFVAFEYLGYMISVTAYLLAMTYFFNKKGRWMVNGLTSVIYGVGSYFIFTQALGVNLPRGLLPF
jgi:putative tricarboxylic transport membrane protein